MDSTWKKALWNQFGASIAMLENALRSCPDDLWAEHVWNDPTAPPGLSEYWYIAYHTLFWLDLYLSGSVEGFRPPEPYSLSELDPAGVLPERQYSREELLSYLQYCRSKCDQTIRSLTEQQASRLCKFSWGEIPFAELLLDNMRHVQEHSAQLHLLLGQRIGSNNAWLTQPKSE